MEGLTKRRWIALTLVAVVLPVSLLTTFKLAGIIPESITLEKTIMRDTVRWNMTQPMGNTAIDKQVKNAYQGEASIELNVRIHSYFDDWGRWGYNDAVAFRASAEANTTVGFIYSVIVKFSQLDSNSVLFWYYDTLTDRPLDRLENLTLKEEYGSATSQREGYVTAFSINQPEHCLLEVEADWVLIHSEDQSHEVSVTLEVIYFNGAAYQQIVLPATLQMLIPTR